MNEHEQQQMENYIRKLAANARAIISYQIGIPQGCLKASKILNWLRKYNGPSYPVFDEYLDAVDHLPIGTERLHWDSEKLQEKDKKLEKVNTRFRESIMDACQNIVRRHS